MLRGSSTATAWSKWPMPSGGVIGTHSAKSTMSGRGVASHDVLSTTSAATIWLTRTAFDDWATVTVRLVTDLPCRTTSTSTDASPIEPGRRNVVVIVRI